jgi:hypothetical protein
MFSIFAEMGTLIGFFAVFDALALDEHKRRISAYLFGARAVSYSEFERRVIAALMGVFMKDEKLQVRRVVVLSFSVPAICVALLAIIALFNGTAPYPYTSLIILLLCLPIIALMSLPFDYWSLRVTKYLFLDHHPRFPFSLLAVGVDAIVSTIPLLVLLLIVSKTVGLPQYNEEAGIGFQNMSALSIAFAFLANLFASCVITFLQAVVLCVGVFLRMVLLPFRFLKLATKISKAEQFPFSFVGFVCALTMVVGQTFWI